MMGRARRTVGMSPWTSGHGGAACARPTAERDAHGTEAGSTKKLAVATATAKTHMTM